MNRRHFLQTSVLAKAGAFIGISYPQITGANERERVDIITIRTVEPRNEPCCCGGDSELQNS